MNARPFSTSADENCGAVTTTSLVSTLKSSGSGEDSSALVPMKAKAGSRSASGRVGFREESDNRNAVLDDDLLDWNDVVSSSPKRRSFVSPSK